ncbi:MAG: PAS domain S-box protein, partial [Deferrisomatales bacterium]
MALTILWTLALGASLWWLLHLQRQDEQAAAAITARVSYEADVKYLNWLSALGGLYVRTEEPFPPDPHFGGLPEHQIRLPDGSDLMPLTPIYVLRLVHELDIVPLEVSSSLRSLTPVVPEDEPDAWERKALGALARGSREVAELGVIDGETYLRLMRPLRLGRDCINCHDKAGFLEGALQGGISVTVPMDRPEEFGRRSDGYVYATHGMLWLLGVGFIGYGTRKLAARMGERDQALAQVSEARNFSDSVLETVDALVVVLDREGRILRFNRACEKATGYAVAEVRGREVWDVLLAPQDRDPFRERFRRLQVEKTPAYHETPWVARNGPPRIIAWSDAPLQSPGGTVEHVIATGIDVTETRQAEAALVESEERYRGLVESSPDAVFVLREDRLVFCNPAGADLLGAARPAQLLERNFLEFVHPALRDTVAGRLRAVADDDRPSAAAEVTLVTREGATVEAEVAAIPFRDRGRGAVQVLARDVGARRRAEQALRDSEARYRTLVENMELGITMIGPDYRVVMSNRAQGRLFQRNPGEFAGQHCYREFQAREGACPECPGTVAMGTGAPASVETVRAGVPLRIQAFPLVKPDGEVNGFIEVVEDITPIKRAEEERIKLEQKILQTQKLESLGVLAGGIAHDFNNLLMGVLGNVDRALAKAPPESPLRPYLDKIEGAAQRAADLTSQMLAYSGRGRFVVEPINLSRLVEELG